jgi:hypothetical protein
MISERNGNITVQSTMQGEKIAMDISANAKAHVMAIMSNLYADRLGAVVREYSTNARDAHIMAGKSHIPIEVTTPNPSAPLGGRNLVIRDHGVGLSVEDVHKVYSQYGESTKNDSNDYNGMLGMGSKSAIAYHSRSFAVNSVKDGVRIAIAVGLDENGLPEMTVLETRTTDEPNGVEIIVPIAGSDDAEAKARALYQYWVKGTVLLNGSPVEDFRSDALHVCDEDSIMIWVDESRNSDDSVIVMGNVAYPAPMIRHKMQRGALIVEVPIGAVNFTPAREALMDTRRTGETLAAIHTLFFKHIQAAAQRDIDQAVSAHDAIKRMYRWESTMARGASGGVYTYQGKTIPRSWAHSKVKVLRDGMPQEISGMVTVPYRKHKLAQHYRKDAIDSNLFEHAIWFTGFDLANFNSNHRKKIDQWLAQQPQAYRDSFTGGTYYTDATFVLVNETPPMEWVSPDRVVPFATIAAIRLNPSTSGGGYRGTARLTGSYDLIEDGTRKTEVQANDIKRDKPLMFLRGNYSNARFYVEALNHFFPKGYTLVYMGENRIGKFQRDFPAAERVRDMMERKSKEWASNIPSDHRIALAMKSEWGLRDDLSAIDPKRVDDPELKNAGRIAKLDLTAASTIRKIVDKTLGRAYLDSRLTWSNPLEKYPLYDRSVLRSDPNHVYHYLNTAYAATI